MNAEGRWLLCLGIRLDGDRQGPGTRLNVLEEEEVTLCFVHDESRNR
jgi:hypothetical protein